MDLILSDEDDKSTEQYIDKLTANPHKAYLFNWRVKSHGLNSIPEWIRSLANFTLSGRGEKISCPTLICNTTGEDKSTGQAEVLFNALTCPKDFMSFRTGLGAGAHCELAVMSLFYQRASEWIATLK